LPSARPPALPPVAPDHGWNTSVGALGFGYASSRGPAWVITNPYTVASNPPYATGPVYGPPAERRTLTVPYWALCAGSAVLPVAAALRRRRARDPEALPCRACGYDLRATPGRCPECGGSCESRT
ncbi:MAG: hypothetical protein ACAI43_09495, partial [Phycisphaerae bacterium]